MSRGGASRAWSWRHAVTRSGLPPTTRHVLLTLSIYMDETGRSCFPKVEDLVEATGLSKRSILTHIEAAVGAGWLKRGLHGFRGQRWRQLEYEPMWPDRDADLPLEADDHDGTGEADTGPCGVEGGEPPAPASRAELVNVVPEAGEPPAPKLVNVVHQDRDQSIHHSKTSPEERERGRASGQAEPPGTDRAGGEGAGQPGEATRPTRAEQLETDWMALKLVWPDIALEAHEACRSKLAGLKAAERRAAIEAVPAFIAFHREKRGKARLPYLLNYLGERRWESLPKPPPASPGEATRAFVGAFDRAWWGLGFAFIARHGAALRDRDSAPAQYLANRFSLALRRIGWAVPSGDVEAIEAAALGMAKAHVDGPEFAAWSAHLYGRFGITLPRPAATDWIWLPAADPAGWPGNGTQESEDAG